MVRDTLMHKDFMKLALNVATRCRIESEMIWESWGLSLLKLGKYKEAREKFSYCTCMFTFC